MELNFTARIVTEIENMRPGMNIAQIIGNPIMGNLNLILRKVLKIDEGAAFELIEKYLEENQTDTIHLQIIIMEALQRKGFLQKSVVMDSLKEEADKPVTM